MITCESKECKNCTNFDIIERCESCAGYHLKLNKQLPQWAGYTGTLTLTCLECAYVELRII
jgi:hypothetical protein